MSSIEQFTTDLARRPPPGSELRSHLVLPPVTPALGPACSTHLPGWLCDMLQAQGIERLTDTQWHTLQLIQQRQHVCLAAPAGAGRGVARLLALYQSLVTTKQRHALCIFPQKQRELDQLKTLTIWNDHLPPEHRLNTEIYDGDTAKTQRRAIKQSPPHLVLTTPEMLHAGILAYHGGWRAFFQNLHHIVLVDLHLYTGALGAHIAHLCRRLYRVCRHYSAQPQYLMTSAPLGNLHDVVHAVTGQPCIVVTGEAWRHKPQSRLLLTVHNDITAVTTQLTTRLNEANLPSLVIDPSTGRSASRQPPAASRQGIIFLGVPGSITRLHEDLARLTNYPKPSLGILMLSGATPLERYLWRYPAVYQASWVQDLALYPNNPWIARQHLLCAAAELALEAGESYTGIRGLQELMHQLASDRVLARRPASRQWIATQRQPHRRVRLRFFEPGFALVHQHTGRLLTMASPEQAFLNAFEGAVIEHDGQLFHVERVLVDRRRIIVRPAQVPYRTRGLLKTQITEPHIEAAIMSESETFRITYGRLCYTGTLHAFERFDSRTQTRTSLHGLTNHHRQYQTQGVWIDFPDTGVPHAAVHTLVHAVLAGLPLLQIYDGTVLNGGVYDGFPVWSKGDSSQHTGDTMMTRHTASVAVFMDAPAGGNGASACLYRAYERALRIALQILLNCNCAGGCDQCVAGLRCMTCDETTALDRQAGVALLQRLLGEIAPPFETVADPLFRKNRTPHHVYVCLSTQKSAEEVGGWQHKHLLGLGVAVAYNTQDERYHVYTVETAEMLINDLRTADLVIGFNLRDFDYQVLQPYTDTPLAALPTLAILDEIEAHTGRQKSVSGLGTVSSTISQSSTGERISVPSTGGFRLSFSHVVRETLGIERPDDSIQTLHWFQHGARDRIIERCRRDVDLLRQLVHHVMQTGTLCYRDHSGERRTIPADWQVVGHYG